VEPEVRYCTTGDGVRIAFRVDGDGPDMVFCPDAVGSCMLDDMIEDQMGFWRLLWHGRRVIRYDMRGTGLSQRDVADVSHAALVQDLAAVVGAAGAHAFTLWGGTLSGPRSITYAAAHPDEVRRLVLHRTFARAKDAMSEGQVRNFADLARVNWKMAAQVFADLPARAEFPEAGVRQARLYVQSTSGEFVSRLLLSGYETADAAHLLAGLRVPTLVLHWTRDPMFSFHLAEGLAAGIPQARLRPLSQGIMSYLASGRIGEVMDSINSFIEDGAATPAAALPASPSLQIVLFTDLVGHTEMMQRLGDARGREVLREHEHITRGLLARYGGSEIKAGGDGFMVSFGSITAALDCAIALQRAFAERNAEAGEPLQVRVGLNAGEPVADAGDLFGSTVILAARIAALADAGEILMPEALRHLLSGKTYEYADRGGVVLKGFEDAVRLYEVRWR
jgi:class 3 adenylate cyclase/pimeloyl-ACP methyl ester carboxylesterase